MTKEDVIEILERFVIGAKPCSQIEIIDACASAYRMLKEQPSLPSNLDEAANRQAALEQPYKWEEAQDGSFGVTPLFVMSNIRSAFKAGAKWMAEQFQKIEGDLVDWYSTSDGKDYCCGIKTIDSFEVPEGFYIRKK